MQQLTDPYRALGVPRGATDAEIKAAHRKLVKRYHPDTGSKSDTERFLRVQEAYRVLSDPLLRKEWDLQARAGTDPGRSSHRPPRHGRRRRPPPPKPQAEPAETAAPPRAQRARSQRGPAHAGRARRAHTPGPRPRCRGGRRRAPTRSSQAAPKQTARPRPTRHQRRRGRAADAPPTSPPFDQQDFDVYNRSSGAAWSMRGARLLPQGRGRLCRGAARSATRARKS